MGILINFIFKWQTLIGVFFAGVFSLLTALGRAQCVFLFASDCTMLDTSMVVLFLIFAGFCHLAELQIGPIVAIACKDFLEMCC